MKVVIMAGGKGTRISELFPDIPKPLIPINGTPVLEQEIISLRDQGFTDIIITVSYLADKIISYLGDGEWLDVSLMESYAGKDANSVWGCDGQTYDNIKADTLTTQLDVAVTPKELSVYVVFVSL